MWLALTFEVLDLAVGGYLLRSAQKWQRHRREPVIFVGAFLLLTSAFLGYVAWKAGHPTMHKFFVPADPTSS